MAEYLSTQSIQDKLQDSQSRSLQEERNQYLLNLKSECMFKQNALKTAQNLILEYQRENEQLKMDKLILTQKIQQFQYKQKQFQNAIQDAREKQKQLLKVSQKLTEIYEKYSSLQKKYYHAQKQISKNKLFQQQNLKKDKQKQKNQHRKSKLQQLNKNQNISHYKQYAKTFYSKEKQQKNYHKYAYNPPQITQWKSKASENNYKEIETLNNDSIKYQNLNKTNKKHLDSITNINQSLKKQLKLLEWRVKQKDEEIMLMLRRNKQIEQKYQTLLKIMQAKQATKIKDRDNLSKPKKLTLHQLTNDSIDNYSTWKNQYLSSFYS